MALAYSQARMANITRVNGKMVCAMGLAWPNIPMGEAMRVRSLLASAMAWGFINSLAVIAMMEVGKMAVSLERASSLPS